MSQELFIIKLLLKVWVCELYPLPFLLCLLLYLWRMAHLEFPIIQPRGDIIVIINYRWSESYFSSYFVQDGTLTNLFMQDISSLINLFFRNNEMPVQVFSKRCSYLKLESLLFPRKVSCKRTSKHISFHCLLILTYFLST